MNLNNFTIKAQEAVAKAQQLAFNNSNPAIETEHLLSALLQDEDSPVEYLLKKNNVNVSFQFIEGESLMMLTILLPTTTPSAPAPAISS